jgi:hypothetical protein
VSSVEESPPDLFVWDIFGPPGASAGSVGVSDDCERSIAAASTALAESGANALCVVRRARLAPLGDDYLYSPVLFQAHCGADGAVAWQALMDSMTACKPPPDNGQS